MVTRQREVERKFEPDDAASLPRLDLLPDVARVATDRHELEAVYFDTADLALAAAGITVRRRSGGDDAGWHLKLPVGDGSRDEVRVPLDRAARSVPKPLRTAVRLHVRDAAISPIATLRTHRSVARLVDADGGVLVEVSEDAVTAHVPTPADGDQATWREWEVELVDGGTALLDQVGALLREAGSRPSRSRSKLVRALGNRLPEAADGERPLHREEAARHVVHRRLRDQVDELKCRDPQVRCDMVDSVHKMRVAIRRLRSALATFRPLLDRDVTDPVRDELRWIADVLGQARDAEVVHERLADAIGAEPADLVVGRVRRRVDTELKGAYRSAHARAVEAMESDRYFALVDALDRLVDETPWASEAERPAQDVLPRRARRDFKRVRRRVVAAEQAETPDDRNAALHEVRKAAKRARYAAETLAPLYGADAERFAKAMKWVQSTLGDHHDTVMARPLLRQLAATSSEAGENAFTYGRLHAAEESRAVGLEERYQKAWAKASSKKLRRWLA